MRNTRLVLMDHTYCECEQSTVGFMVTIWTTSRDPIDIERYQIRYGYVFSDIVRRRLVMMTENFTSC